MLAVWHLASLDAPTVAVVWSLAFAWTVSVRLPAWTPLLLALMAWFVYVGDRLLDAHTALRVPEQHSLRERHYFHWRHRHVLVPLAAIAALAAARIIFVNMPRGALTPNSVLGAATFAYFSGVHARRKLPQVVNKEFLVGVIFTASCVLPALLQLNAAHASARRVGAFAVLGIYFAALAWLNCHAIAKWESHSAERMQHAAVDTLGCLHAAAGIVLAGFLAADHPRISLMLAAGAASTLLLVLLDRKRERLTPLALRAAADLVLLTPILIVPVMRLQR